MLLLFAAISHAASPAAPSIAVLVHAEKGGEALADPLRVLLETEVSTRYEGALLERAQIATVLQEMKLSSLLGGANAGGVQKGKIEGAACLVLARVGEKEVRLTVTGFPKTDIVLERTYNERLEADSLAERIAGDALTAVRGWNRDPKVPYVAIGSFYCPDPHQRLLEFSRTTETEMRKQLAATPGVRLVERLFPSDLLKEFDLARTGMVSQATDFSAPPADLLIYGEGKLRAKQELSNPSLIIDATLTVTSPTGLIPTVTAEVTCRSEDIAPLIARAQEMLVESVTKATASLSTGTVRTLSAQEFESFKKQAHRLMPAPPNEDGTFYSKGSHRGWGQYGKREELERALRMLECAQLFTATDTTLLICTASLLSELSRMDTVPSGAQNAMREAAVEFSERAYRMENTLNTRSFYADYGLDSRLPEAEYRVATHIWTTRDKEPWQAHQVDNAFRRFVAGEQDDDKRAQLILDEAPGQQNRKDGLRNLGWVVQPMLFFIRGTRGTPAMMPANERFAEKLLASESQFLQALGHLVALDLAYMRLEIKPEESHFKDFVKHHRACTAMFPSLVSTHKTQFTDTNLAYLLAGYLSNKTPLFEKHGRMDELTDVQESYVIAQMATGKYDVAGLGHAMNRLIPKLRERGQDERALGMLEEFLGKFAMGGSAEVTRMELTRQLNAIRMAKAKYPFLKLEELTPVPFDDGANGWTDNLTLTNKGIFGVRLIRKGNGETRAIRIVPDENRAMVIKSVARVRDVASTSKYAAMATEGNGLYLLDVETEELRQLTPDNSALPSAKITHVGATDKKFLIVALDKNNRPLFYFIDPEGGTITNFKSGASSRWDIRSDTRLNPKVSDMRAIPQTWEHRTIFVDGKEIHFGTLGGFKAVKNAKVFEKGGASLLEYTGFELSFVNDFALWQSQLIFATGNGLYVSKPGSNEIRCILSEPDLFMTSCLPVNDRLYLGTSKGLYVLGSEQLNKIVGP